jgi:hypothetical protein
MVSLVLPLATAIFVMQPVKDTAPPTPLSPIVVSPQGTPKRFLPTNTEVILAMNDDLTTKGGKIEEGTMFYLTVANDVKLGDYVVIPRGARGAGEVTWKTGKAAFGKSGKMEVELRWVEVGNQRIPIEGKYRQEGEGNTVATVGTVVAVGVFAAFVTGKSARIPRGRELSARTKFDIPVDLPNDTSAPVTAQPTMSLPVVASPEPSVAPAP